PRRAPPTEAPPTPTTPTGSGSTGCSTGSPPSSPAARRRAPPIAPSPIRRSPSAALPDPPDAWTRSTPRSGAAAARGPPTAPPTAPPTPSPVRIPAPEEPMTTPHPTTAPREIVLHRRYATSAEDVWAAFTESDRLARWIGHYIGRGQAGGTVEFTV